MDSDGISLTKYLSTSGVCSRRGAEALIVSGRVKVNGQRAERGAMRILPGDRVEFDGRTVAPLSRKFYIMLNKPRGYVCTLEDRHAEKKAVDLIPQARETRLVSAGRLDKDSEGLILFSNDGDFVARLTHPRYEVEKTYRVSLSGELTAEAIRQLTGPGVPSEGDRLRARAIRPTGPGHYDFILSEGKNREIRRMAAYFHLDVKRLARIAVGAVRLGGLECGQCRSLSPAEIEALFQPASSRSDRHARVSQTAGGPDPSASCHQKRSGGQSGRRPGPKISRRAGTALRDGRTRRTKDPVRFESAGKNARPAAERPYRCSAGGVRKPV
ncbi:MAG: rRNA pseudouridine synthase [Lentisphaeria bacterium]|nr:rRNA pseudouridine synthase [Lentisphaeria bacterium]